MVGAEASASNSMTESGPRSRLRAEAWGMRLLYSWVREAASAIERGDDEAARVMRVHLDPDLVRGGLELEDGGVTLGRDEHAPRLARREDVIRGDGARIGQAGAFLVRVEVPVHDHGGRPRQLLQGEHLASGRPGRADRKS